MITLDAKTKTDSAESASTAGLGIIYGTRDAVAWAICAACEERPDAAGDARGNEKRWQDYLDVADAAIAAMAGGGVLVCLHRHEGYEDAHPQLVAEDAIGDRWPSYETLMPNVELTGSGQVHRPESSDRRERG